MLITALNPNLICNLLNHLAGHTLRLRNHNDVLFLRRSVDWFCHLCLGLLWHLDLWHLNLRNKLKSFADWCRCLCCFSNLHVLCRGLVWRCSRLHLLYCICHVILLFAECAAIVWSVSLRVSNGFVISKLKEQQMQHVPLMT